MPVFTDFELAWFRKPLDEPRGPRRDPLSAIARVRHASEPPMATLAPPPPPPPPRARVAEGDPWFGV